MVICQHPDPSVTFILGNFHRTSLVIRKTVGDISDQQPQVGLVYTLAWSDPEKKVVEREMKGEKTAYLNLPIFIRID
jgi:hypothetical protein